MLLRWIFFSCQNGGGRKSIFVLALKWVTVSLMAFVRGFMALEFSWFFTFASGFLFWFWARIMAAILCFEPTYKPHCSLLKNMREFFGSSCMLMRLSFGIFLTVSWIFELFHLCILYSSGFGILGFESITEQSFGLF